MSTTVYSQVFIQLSQLERQWRERKCPVFETVAKGYSNPGSLDCESGILPLSYRAPRADVPDYITIRVNDPVEKLNHFKYLGSLKSSDGGRMCELTTLSKDRSIPVALRIRLVKTLVWTVVLRSRSLDSEGAR